MSHSPLSRYEQLVEHCEISRDSGQEDVVRALQDVYNALQDASAPTGLLSKWFSAPSVPEKQGLYLWGGVGRGKSMLMDMFYESLERKDKRRVHFHGFMLEVHEQLHLHRQNGKDDPIEEVITAIIKNYKVLCFDEIQVHDVADAMLLARMFSAFFKAGLVIVFTSNRPPEDLYLHGLQRERFIPFIELINNTMQIMEIQVHQDYRQNRLEAIQKRYLCPVTGETNKALHLMFEQMISHASPQAMNIPLQGRSIFVPQAYRDVAYFDFTDLCSNAYGAADYLELASIFKIFFISNIPQMSPAQRNEAKRFVTLIDVLYEADVTLCCSAASEPETLYDSGDGSFEFERTASRLREMMSDDYGKSLQ